VRDSFARQAVMRLIERRRWSNRAAASSNSPSGTILTQQHGYARMAA
jgi:hypothetical protein